MPSAIEFLQSKYTLYVAGRERTPTRVLVTRGLYEAYERELEAERFVDNQGRLYFRGIPMEITGDTGVWLLTWDFSRPIPLRPDLIPPEVREQRRGGWQDHPVPTRRARPQAAAPDDPVIDVVFD